MSLQSVSWQVSALASSSRQTLRPSAPCRRLGRRYSTEPRTDELRQRPLPDILATLRSQQKKLAFPPGRVRALAMRYDKFAMSSGFREFINVDVPRIKYANPHLLIRPYILSSIPYPPPKAPKSSSKRKQATKSDNIPRISDETPVETESIANSSADGSSGPEVSLQPSEDVSSSSTSAEASVSSSDAVPAEDTEEPEMNSGEIQPDPSELDGGKWRERFKAAKDKNRPLPNEVIIEYDGRPHRTIPFAGDDSSVLIKQILDIVNDKEILLDAPEQPDLLAMEADEALGIESTNADADSGSAPRDAVESATEGDSSAEPSLEALEDTEKHTVPA